MTKPLWHRPRITTVVQVLPFKAATLFTLHDGRRLLVADTPVVVNTTDDQNKARQAELNRKYQTTRRQKKRDAKKKKRKLETEQFLDDVMMLATKRGDKRPPTPEEWREIARVAAIRSFGK